MTSLSLSLLLENLQLRFDQKRFKASASKRRHSGLRDAFFETTFQEMFVEATRPGRDDLLFYVRYDHNADRDVVDVLRRDSKNLPTSVDPTVQWDKSLYLNVILHEFDYHVTCSVITLKPGSDSISSAKRTVKLKVFPSPTERRMDKKGGDNDLIYPDIMFCVDGFEEIFQNIQLSNPGEKVAVQLLAVNKSIKVSRMVFLGAVDYQALKIECIKRDQNSLSRRLKRLSLTRITSNGKKSAQHHTYSFVKMHGPKMKGFAEMAVARVNHHELVPPLPAPGAPPSSSSSFQSNLKPTISPRLVVATKNGAPGSSYHHHDNPSIPTIVVPDNDAAPSKSVSPSPLHLHAHHSTTTPMRFYHERSHSSPVGSPGSDEAYYSTASPSYSSVMEAEDFRMDSRPGSGVLVRQSSRDSFLSNDSALEPRHERSRSYTGPSSESDTISVTSATPSTASSSSSSRGFRKTASSGRPRSKSGSDMAVGAYLTYITLPWHCIIDDILNSTRKRVL